MNYTDLFFSFLGVCLIAVLIIGLLLAYFFRVYVPFADERDFIKMEIMRCDEDGRRKWTRRLRELYISQIPILGRIILSMMSSRRKRR